MKKVLIALISSVLISLGLAATVSATPACPTKTITYAAGQEVVNGASNVTLIAGSNVEVASSGSNKCVVAGNNDFIVFSGANNQVTAGTNTTLVYSGTLTYTLGAGSKVI